MKKQFQICIVSAMMSSITYLIFMISAYRSYPLPFSPWKNWLSDLGNQIVNPQGATCYNTGVILCAFFLSIWFTLGQSQWKLKGNAVQLRLLLISQITGSLAGCALLMSALYPINHPAEHAFWSDVNFILFGISFAFSVAALRYHRTIPRLILFTGAAAAILPTLVLALNSFYWLEWLAISLFIVYISLIGITAYAINLHSPGTGEISIQV